MMKKKHPKFFRLYQAHLRKHLGKPGESDMQLAGELGEKAIAAGLRTLDLARFHEQLIGRCFSAADHAKMVRRAGKFFARVITPIEKKHRLAHETNTQLARAIHVLKQRTAQLAASNQNLKCEVLQRKEVEKALRTSQRHSRTMQNQLRHLSHQVLSAQEDERKRISRELHDEIAQSLGGITVLLASLKAKAGIHDTIVQQKIDRTQRLVETTAGIVHQFARDLRPRLLDDLGLIPALHAFFKSFTKETGVRVHLTVFASVETLDNTKRTVLYRVAQEALINVDRHAEATAVEVNIQKVEATVCMTIRDNGKCPKKDPMQQLKRGKRLGLIGMRERVEMVGGNFNLRCVEGEGAVVQAIIPLAHTTGSRKAR